MIVVVRDPRDVCISYYNWIVKDVPQEYSGTLQGFVPLFLQGKGKDWAFL